MFNYQGKAGKYFTGIIAALIIVAVSIGFFIYSLLFKTPAEIDINSIIYIPLEDGTPTLNPSGTAVPDKPPYVPPPTFPPPN